MNGGRRRQIDFCLFDWGLRSSVVNAKACEGITIGADHRAVLSELLIDDPQRTREMTNRKVKARPSMWGWRPSNAAQYRAMVND